MEMVFIHERTEKYLYVDDIDRIIRLPTMCSLRRRGGGSPRRSFVSGGERELPTNPVAGRRAGLIFKIFLYSSHLGVYSLMEVHT